MRFRAVLLIAALLPLAAAHAGPQGGNVVGGAATISGQGGANITVNQFSPSAIINWSTFNLAPGERATFVQPSASSIVLNRVTGGLGPSQISGTIDANGRVILVNRDGVVFGAGASINTAGFLATTADINNADFMAGRYNFSIPGRPDASIVNQGRITATSGGFAALVAPGVRNAGTITANLGTVVLGAGNTFTLNLDFYGDRLITLGVGDVIAAQVKDVATGQPLSALVTNTGKLKANGGTVQLTAAAARTVVDSVINTSGVIEANSVGMRNGQIVLSAATAGTKGAGAPTQTVRVSGKLSAAGKKAGTTGGKIIVTGENIVVANAKINASGQSGGGTVMIGGDWGGGSPNTSLVNNQSAVLDGNAIPHASTVSVDANSRINASAITSGNGGKVILWSDQYTSFAGTILALGGKTFGNGGFVETSGHEVNITGSVNAGRGGTWLLDPDDLTINPPLASSISSSLNGGTNVTEQTTSSGSGGNGDIFVSAQIVWNTSATLTLSAYRNIIINDTGVSGTIKNTGGGNLVLHANSEGAFGLTSGNGVISMPASTFATRVDWTGSTGTVTVFYNPSSYSSPTNFTSGNGSFSLASPSQLTAYMLVNSSSELSLVGTSGNYAVSKDITAGTFSPIGSAGSPFSGIFDGLGHTISGLMIAPNITGINNIGMFGAIGTGAIVRNLTLSGATVTANPVQGAGQFVGVLAGQNAGTVSNVTITGSSVSNGTVNNGILAGGLVGQNQSTGTIQNSTAAVTVTVGNSTTGSQENNAGGLVGVNLGLITGSSASGAVFGGSHSNLGGLVGRNEVGATIASSSASGTVAADTRTGDQNTVGGLVGFNFGAITNSSASGQVAGASNGFFGSEVGGLAGLNDLRGTIDNSFATGNVFGGINTSTGGFTGFNQGSITNSHATGIVAGIDNATGGFVGGNQGSIDNSFATGLVTGGGEGTGGFVGFNMVDFSTGRVGTITNSRASGNVIDISNNGTGAAGGFAGENQSFAIISNSHATGNVVGGSTTAGGFVGTNDAFISNSTATGNVLIGSNGAAGGFAGESSGQITGSSASGSVGGGGSTFLGGFAGGNLGLIDSSTASGPVIATGAGASVGGFAGMNFFGTISNSSSSGPVTGTSSSYLGGLVGLNIGLIQNDSSSSSVTGTGGNNVAGGLVGLNFGFVDPSSSTGSVTTGPNSIAGGFIGANGALQFPGFAQIGTFDPPAGTPGPVNAGPGSTTGPQVGQQYPTSGVPQPPADPCNAGGFFCGGTLFNPGGTQTQNVQLVNSPLLNIAVLLTVDPFQDKKPQDVVNTNGTNNTATGPGGNPGNQKGGNQNGGRPPNNVVPPVGLGPLPSGMPPIGETRFLTNEVVMQLGANLTPEQVAALAAKYGLEIVSTQTFTLLGRTVYRFRITGNLAVRQVIAGLQSGGATISAQPSYTFQLVQDTPAPASTNSQSAPTPATQNQGDSAQYVVAKLGLIEAHGIATGKGVKIAVIDSEIDAQHPDLQGVVAGSFDALPSSDQTPHSHGTGMAGAIGSHQRLLGVAPGARLLGIRAFGVSTEGAQGTSMNIVKGLEWAVSEGAQIINMSFAGPHDPILEQALKSLKDRGIILVGAAGNAGPKSPPLFPGADPNVIGVSATDLDDKTFKGANRGKQVAIAAPGVDILVPAPEGGYQLTTGTSVAAAEVSGVIALMLERNPRLAPNDVRNILAATAKKLPQGRLEVGAGLIDPVQALAKSGPKQAQAR